ncbi:hypothetical protein O1611_g3184 [Lasiodiplodia mahajangana]|uniref:Uncharacterized protein n=1 Tax=Lasiodiplodia mahajangana TaxID=1108764 RepID=A0ACC2JSX0_9PEZI|nr:hypothetical protein O1611_g3184 [Lasiodiplodia mahajangana]
MYSRPIPSSQARPQPVLPSQQSHYFSNGVTDHPTPQNRGRLLPYPPRLYRPPEGIPSRGSPMSPFQPRQQLRPFFSQGPAAMGYIPQQPIRYPRSFGPREPIVPMRNEASRVHSSQRTVALHELEQTRPYSVPSHYTRTSQADHEQSVSVISRPTSAAYIDTRKMFESDLPNLNPLPESSEETPKLSSCKRKAADDQSFGELLPPKRKLPFPSSKQTKAQAARAEGQLEATNTKALPLNAASTSAQKVSPCENSSGGTAKRPETSKPQLRSSKRLADKNALSKGRTETKLVNQCANPSKGSSHNARTLASTRSNEDTSQVSESIQMPERCLNNDGISGNLNTIHSMTDVRARDTNPPRERELSQPQDMAAGKAFVAPSFALKDLSSNSIDPALSSSRGRNYEPEVPQEPLRKTDASTYPAAKRSASQATTVSTTSTEISQTGGGENHPEVKELFNPMSMIDGAMILERDISGIFDARLRAGNADLLETLKGEILIKMAVKDDQIFETVRRSLQQ